MFVSYAHIDTHHVKPVVELLRVARAEVFLDSDSQRHGLRWRQQVDDAIKRASTIIVFWCGHASGSPEVLRELNIGRLADKDFLPVLLDNTKPPDWLLEFQYVDLRSSVKHDVHASPSRARSPASVALLVALTAGAILFLALADRWATQALFTGLAVAILVGAAALLVVAIGRRSRHIDEVATNDERSASMRRFEQPQLDARGIAARINAELERRGEA